MADQIYSYRERTDFLVVHCSASKAGADIGLAEIDRWHAERGFIGVGYHYIIRRSGVVETGRPVDTIGAHVAGYNWRSIGICLIGGVSESGAPVENYTAEQWVSLRRLLLQLHAAYPNAAVCGHRDFPEVRKDCPCFHVRMWWAQVKNEVDA